MAMKVTSEPCFKNGSGLMMWQERNCCRCQKAVWYNAKLDRYPNYKCAVQRDIEHQAAGIMEINERSFHAAHETSTCPFFKGKEEDKTPEEVLDFSKGESVFNETPMFNDIEHARNIEHATPEVPQKKPEKVENPIDPELMKLAMENGIDYDVLKKAEQIVPSEMAKAKKRASLAYNTEEQFKQDVRESTRKMLNTFTWEENMMIAFVPLVIEHIAWMYADKVMKQCADLHISETKKLSRVVKQIREEYNSLLKKDLDVLHIRRIQVQTEEFCKLHQNDFTILWYCVKNQYRKQFPDDPYAEMRTDAYISILMCKFIAEHNKRMDALIATKIQKKTKSIQNPLILKLQACMDAYCGNDVIDKNEHIEAALRILQKNVAAINFEIDDKL